MEFDQQKHFETFKTAEGNNYRQVNEIDLEAVQRQLQALGFEVLSLEPHWRHICAHLRQDQDYFFKMATSEGVAERTRNEVAWNNQINEQQTNLTVPKVQQVGELDGHFYYLADYINAKPIVEKNPETITNVQPYLVDIATIALSILRLKPFVLPRDNDFSQVSSGRQRYLGKAQQWLESLHNPDKLQPLLEIAKTLADQPIASMNHGDFVPWHILESSPLTLIDGEHANSQTPLGYDISYGYHRIYTATQSPYLAHQFLDHIHHQATTEEWALLQTQLPPLLALRTIGGYVDMAVDQTPQQQPFHDQLLKQLIEQTIFEDII